MHRVAIPQYAIDRALSRRDGRRYAFDSIDPARTALLVIDLQNGFMAPGQPGEIGLAREIVPNVNRLADALRNAGGTVVWLRHTITPEAGAKWPLWLNSFGAGEWSEQTRKAFAPGSYGHELYPALAAQPVDLTVDKYCFSAFINDSSSLDKTLREKGIDTVIITGTATNVCCESTARDAMMLNYKVHFVSDATACRTDEEHNATLAVLTIMFADVRSTNEIIRLLRPDQLGNVGAAVSGT
jgi:ureidoacrylate peracid hydrolase